MSYSIAQFFLLGFLTFALVGLITPPIRYLALRINAVDAPNLERKVQKEPVPYLVEWLSPLGLSRHPTAL